MSEKLDEKLQAFGLSSNQAKVYACMIEFGYTSVREISDATHIHPQDIYKALEKLEKKGLILKTCSKPLKIEAIPAKEGLKQLLLSLKQESKEKINILETHYEHIRKTIGKEVPKVKNSNIFLLSKEAPLAKINSTFENLRIEYDLLWPDGSFKWLDYLEDQFKKIARRGARIRILIFSKGNEFVLANAMEKIMPETAEFEIRTLQCTMSTCFALIDFREVWLPVTSIDKNALLITDAEEIALLAKQQFETLWNDPRAKIKTQRPALTV